MGCKNFRATFPRGGEGISAQKMNLFPAVVGVKEKWGNQKNEYKINQRDDKVKR